MVSPTDHKNSFLNSVYNNSSADDPNGRVQFLDPLTIFMILSTLIGLLLQFSQWLHDRKPKDIQDKFQNLNLIQRMIFRRYVRKAIKQHGLEPGDYEQGISNGVIKTFSTASLEEIDGVIHG